jgi:hypothetical protein
MPLTPGTRLGPYEIAGTLGAGGMGEVYRARDTRLERKVAIKLEWLQKAEIEQNSAILYGNVDRMFAWLREDPRFEELLTQLNLR